MKMDEKKKKMLTINVCRLINVVGVGCKESDFPFMSYKRVKTKFFVYDGVA